MIVPLRIPPRLTARLVRAAVPLVLASAACASAAHAAGAWKSYLYPGYFSDLLATDSVVWSATREGALLRLDRLTGTLETIVREPGGLASNQLTSLASDRSGHLWVGTLDAGVSRLSPDGASWEVVNRLDGLPSNAVTTLSAAGDTMWIGTEAGIALWDPRGIQGSLPDGNTVSFDTTFHSLEITGIVQLGDSLWLATPAGIGLARVSTGLTDWRPVNQGLGSLAVADLAWDGNQLVAMIPNFAMYRFRFDLGTWEFAPNTGAPLTATGSPHWLLVCTPTGVYRWDGAQQNYLAGSPVPYHKSDGYGDLMRATAAPDGAVFVGTGATLYERTPALAWIPHTVQCPIDNSLIALGVDQGRLYAGAFLGFSRFDGAAWRWWPSSLRCAGAECDTTFQNTAFGIGLFIDSQHTKWAGFWTSALDRFADDTDPWSFQHLAVDVSDDTTMKRTWTYSGAEDAVGHVWLGMDTPAADVPEDQPLGVTFYTLAGIYLGNRSHDNSQMRGTYVRALAREPGPAGRMWLGYRGQGVDFVDPVAGDDPAAAGFRHLNDSDGLFVRGIAAYGETLWVLSETDLRRYRLPLGETSKSQETQAIAEGQADLGVKPLAVQGDGTLWIATNGGLRVWHPGVKFEDTPLYSTTNSPIVSNAVRALALAPDGSLWIATAGGLQSFDPFYVPPPPAEPASFSLKIYPNPVGTTGMGVRLHLAGAPVGAHGAVYDLSGRRVRTFQVAGADAVFWDGRDQDGRLVRPGIYFVRAISGGHEARARLVILR